MKIKLIIISIILLLVMIFASGCIPIMEKLGLVSPTKEEQLTPEKGGPPDGLVKVLIGFKEKPGAPEQALVKGLGGKIKYTYNLIPAIAASVPEVAIEALKKNPNITDVELDSMVYALDAELDNSWGVDRIDAEAVHASGNKGAEVQVAIIDTGIDHTHPDLCDNYAGGYDFVNDDNNPMDDDITYSHGTHVAGIIVAALDNDFGVVGVAPEASLYALKALNSEGVGYVRDIVAAIEWAIENEIQVINMSLGGRKNIFLEWACDSAYSDGLLLVAAAGNGGAVIYPAAYSSVIAVSATDEYDNLASFSSTGKQVELAAPGVGIYSTYIGGGYATLSGTSMAAPHVAGTAALVWAAAENTSLYNYEVREKLQATAEDIGLSTREQGFGLVDAENAVLGNTGGDDLPPTATGTISGTVTYADTGFSIVGGLVTTNGHSTSTDAQGIYTLADLPVDSYTVTASAEGYESASEDVTVIENDTIIADFFLNPLPVNGTMYVDSITFSEKKAGPNYFLYITVRVVDGSSTTLEGAGVEMTLANGGSSWYFVGDTDVDGMVKFTQKKAPSGSYTATVTKLTLTGYTWDKTQGKIWADHTF